MGRAVLLRQLRTWRPTAGGADQLQAQRLGPLAGDQAHAAGCGMEQHEVARPAARPAAGVRLSRYCAVRPLSIMAAPVSNVDARRAACTRTWPASRARWQ